MTNLCSLRSKFHAKIIIWRGHTEKQEQKIII